MRVWVGVGIMIRVRVRVQVRVQVDHPNWVEGRITGPDRVTVKVRVR